MLTREFIAKLAKPYGDNSLMGFDHIEAFARAIEQAAAREAIERCTHACSLVAKAASGPQAYFWKSAAVSCENDIRALFRNSETQESLISESHIKGYAVKVSQAAIDLGCLCCGEVREPAVKHSSGRYVCASCVVPASK